MMLFVVCCLVLVSIPLRLSPTRGLTACLLFVAWHHSEPQFRQLLILSDRE
ncbi:MAG: hypothetical protein AAGA60_05645 [Cyanobacteria bacterium P01_E01_bin.42]